MAVNARNVQTFKLTAELSRFSFVEKRNRIRNVRIWFIEAKAEHIVNRNAADDENSLDARLIFAQMCAQMLMDKQMA